MIDHADTDTDHGRRDETPSASPRPAGLFCTSCGVSLLDVSVEGACPSCGVPVMRSLNGEAPALQAGPTSGFAITSLVLGILSIVGCMLYGLPSIVLGPLAIIYAKRAKKQVEERTAGGSTVGLATAGLTLGIIGTVFGVLGLALVGFGFLMPLLLGGFP